MDQPAKVLLIGKSGAGKTGSLASLVAAGYRLRIIDTDTGVRPLASLLTDSRYPYAKVISEQGIDLSYAVRFQSIDVTMKLRTVTQKIPGTDRTTTDTLLAPNDAKAWNKVLTLLDGWKDGDLDLGSVSTWDTHDILVIDSFSTLAKCVYYFSQAMNGRLGARDSGYDYQRDIGEAQSQLTRLLELLKSPVVKCNVIVISHITWVDESAGVASRPKEVLKDGGISMSSPDGYPSAIGRALSPQMGKYFNDCFVMRSEGSGSSVRRTISTVPQEGVMAKHSVYLDRDYPVSSGMGQIFSAILNRPLPQPFLDAFGKPAGGSRPTVPPSAPSKVEPRAPISAQA
jgi:hypothetical protein